MLNALLEFGQKISVEGNNFVAIKHSNIEDALGKNLHRVLIINFM